MLISKPKVEILRQLDNPKILESYLARLDKYQVKTPGCWGWLGTVDSHGYPKLSLGRNYKNVKISRATLYLKDGMPPLETSYALHTCDNPVCTNPDHLYWGTAKLNTRDAIERHRHKSPPILTRDLTTRCVIKTKDINTIIELAKTKTSSQIADIYGVTQKTIIQLLSSHKVKAFDSRFGKRKVVHKQRKLKLDTEDFRTRAVSHTVSQLARHFNVKRGTIYNTLSVLGIPQYK